MIRLLGMLVMIVVSLALLLLGGCSSSDHAQAAFATWLRECNNDSVVYDITSNGKDRTMNVKCIKSN